MRFSIIAIGDELLIGQVIDTNSGDISRRLAPLGWELNDVQVVGDDAVAIRRAIDRAFATSDIVITTGGLGPTNDDITKNVMCEYFGGELIEDPEVLENVKHVVMQRGLKLNELTARQALVPSSCKVIQNLVGTAPIMLFERDGKILVSMPGVPFETREMLDSAIVPMLQERFPRTEHIEHRTAIVVSYSESLLAMTISDWENSLPPFLHLAYLPKAGMVRLRIDGRHTDSTLLINAINHEHRSLIELLGEHVICDRDLPLEEILLEELEVRNLTIATAESCTGGNIAHLITSVPGSSRSYVGGIVAYSNRVKSELLGVDPAIIRSEGAVSGPVVQQMVTGACHVYGTQCAIATSGIAGPGGGSDTKPVGTVWIAVHSPAGTIKFSHHFPGGRQRVIQRASMVAMIMLIQELQKLPRRPLA